MSKKTFKKSVASIFIAVVLIVSLIPLSNLPGVGVQTYGSDENIEFKISPQRTATVWARWYLLQRHTRISMRVVRRKTSPST